MKFGGKSGVDRNRRELLDLGIMPSRTPVVVQTTPGGKKTRKVGIVSVTAPVIIEKDKTK